jgi:hypothetical protein
MKIVKLILLVQQSNNYMKKNGIRLIILDTNILLSKIGDFLFLSI